jgi:hypothetical protein
MTIYYCDSEKAFYNSAVHAPGQIPLDAIAISKALYESLLDGQSGLKRIGLDASGAPALLDVASPAVDYAELIAAKRYEHETAGITLQGMAIDTGRDSQGLITGAVVQAMLDPSYTLNWKTAVGFVQLTAVQIIGIATAVRAHVQACFDREATLLVALQDGSFSPELLSEGWPA